MAKILEIHGYATDSPKPSIIRITRSAKSVFTKPTPSVATDHKKNPAARTHFAAVEADPNVDEHLKRMNKALFAAAEGEWTSATDSLREILEKDAENYVVCFLLYF